MNSHLSTSCLCLAANTEEDVIQRDGERLIEEEEEEEGGGGVNRVSVQQPAGGAQARLGPGGMMSDGLLVGHAQTLLFQEIDTRESFLCVCVCRVVRVCARLSAALKHALRCQCVRVLSPLR